MENYTVTITHNKVVHHFEIADHPHHNEQHCKYKVFENGSYVASFEPGPQYSLHVCGNPGQLDNKLINLLAEKIEAHLPHPPVKHVQRDE